MPRASRYLLPGRLYHLTHRCHDRRFLLKFAKDRDDYRALAIEMSRASGVTVLSYCLTSNHVHILLEAGGKGSISRFMQDLAGTFALYYKQDMADRIQCHVLQRESQWTDAVAVGTKSFVESVQHQLPDRRRWQIAETVFGNVSGSILREPTPPYMRFSAVEMAAKG